MKISIIVAAYNIEEYLSRCLDSIIGQTYKDLEIIVVDDGSTDSTGVIADSYAQKDPRITVIHQENAGLSGARNAALKVIKGEYVGFVDGDDYIEPDMYEKLANACYENNAQLAVCAYNKVYADEKNGGANESIKVRKHDAATIVLTREEAFNIYVCDNREFHIYNSVWSKLFKREIISGFNFPVGKNSEDIMFTTKAMGNSTTVVFVNKPLYNYVLEREGSIMNTRNASKQKLSEFARRRFEDEIPFWEEQIHYLEDLGLVEISCKAAYQLCRRLLYYYLDFRKKGMEDSAVKLAGLIKARKKSINSLYRNDFVKRGDRARMRLFLIAPALYAFVVNVYDHTIIPLRQ